MEKVENQKLRFVFKLSDYVQPNNAKVKPYLVYNDKVAILCSFSTIAQFKKLFGTSEFFRLIKHLLLLKVRFVKLNTTLGSIGVIKKHVYVSLNFTSHEAIKYYDFSGDKGADIKALSVSHSKALQHLNSIESLSQWVPEASELLMDSSNEFGSIAMSLMTGQKFEKKDWDNRLPKLVSILVDFYFSQEGFSRDVQHELKKGEQGNDFRNWFETNFPNTPFDCPCFNVMVHGDFQHHNVLFDQALDVKIIDWGGYMRGLFYDVVSTSRFYLNTSELSPLEEQSIIKKSRFYRLFIKELSLKNIPLSEDEITCQLALAQFRKTQGV